MDVVENPYLTYYTYLEFAFTHNLYTKNINAYLLKWLQNIKIKVFIFMWSDLIYSKNIHLFRSNYCIPPRGMSLEAIWKMPL